MKRFHLISLGCPKNLVDSECLYGQLSLSGWTSVSTPEEADVLIVNTCGFIQPAVEESIEEILQLAAFKEVDPQKKVVVVGCLVQRYGRLLLEQLPEVDLFVGTEGVLVISGLLDTVYRDEQPERLVIPDRFLMDAAVPRQLSTPFFRAWLKVAEGCNNCCSYCLIPAIRGPLRSRDVHDLVKEALHLEQGGVRELSLVAQDLTAYGLDRDGSSRLIQLLEALLAGTNIAWIRLLYLYPSGVSEALLEVIASEPRIVPYLDIPLQHVSDSVLRAMNRRYGRRDINQLLARLRAVVPGAALRTTVMVGFPGETEKDFAELIEFLRLARFNHLGAFAYANEEGCAAEGLAGQVDEETKQQRLDAVLSVQAEISADIQQRAVGSIETVLVEGVSRETDLLLEGRTRYQAPEIDGCVLINDGEASPGDFVQVEITEAHVYDLVGRIVP
ncbi:30S ribosomal protein S12 methylthiotransferase RimO [Desulfofustis limnaeus]|uniref:Ribosomal protein uS12 methylthiotransferase RimO n=1 Tax=Desulfofustis limnaeus TaxID=2740163 RepID=A0ABN6LYU0_9BACT|nr:30S ribosomal protein S12 methylthiotransferase RimO [Desulfofustis limnaeus]BDD85771.1 ribosomal protein S12 methylthiotransferase RimO [Desulfofustis limnaeus]